MKNLGYKQLFINLASVRAITASTAQSQHTKPSAAGFSFFLQLSSESNIVQKEY